MTDPSQAPLPPPAASAKLLGSSAFSAGSFSQALQHYDAALEIAPDAAVLYSNRSVTYLKLERLEDALKDALRASELAPAWARAWQRVGQAEEASGNTQSALSAFEKALSLVADKSPDKAAYTVAVQRLSKRLGPRIERVKRANEVVQSDMPWARFLQKVTEGNGALPEGTACAKLVRAWQSWHAGEEALSEQTTVPSPSDPSSSIFKGNPMAIQHLSNGVLADDRVFSLSSSSLLEQLNAQISHDADIFGFNLTKRGYRSTYEPWSVDTSGGWDAVRAQVTTAIEAGWHTAKWRLSLSVRVAVLKGAIATKALSNPAEGARQLSWALGLIRWIRKDYKDASSEERGTSFEASFERAVSALLLSAHQAVRVHPSLGRYLALTLSQLYGRRPDPSSLRLIKDLATSVLASIDEFPAPTPPLALTFDTYPAASAYMALGLLYHRQSLVADAVEPAAKQDLLRASAESYARAVALLPPDDDLCTTAMVLVIQSALAAGGATMGTLGSAEQAVRQLVAEQAPIWSRWREADGSVEMVNAVLGWAASLSSEHPTFDPVMVLPPVQGLGVDEMQAAVSAAAKTPTAGASQNPDQAVIAALGVVASKSYA